MDLQGNEAEIGYSLVIIGAVLFLGLIYKNKGFKKMNGLTKFMTLVFLACIGFGGAVLGKALRHVPGIGTSVSGGEDTVSGKDIVFDLTNPMTNTSMGTIRCTHGTCPTGTISYPSGSDYVTLIQKKGIYDILPQELKDKFKQCESYKLCFSSSTFKETYN